MFTLPWIMLFAVTGWWFWIMFLIISGVIIKFLDDTSQMMSEGDEDFDAAAAGWAFCVLFVGCILWFFFGDAITRCQWVIENPGRF